MSVPTAKMAITTPLIVHAADALQRARKLPAGPVRNDLRALARALLRLHKAGPARERPDHRNADSALERCRSMRVGFLPQVRIGLFRSGPLLLLGIALPGLVRLRVRSPIRSLPGIVFWRLLAHRHFLRQEQAITTETVPEMRGNLTQGNLTQGNLTQGSLAQGSLEGSMSDHWVDPNRGMASQAVFKQAALKRIVFVPDLGTADRVPRWPRGAVHPALSREDSAPASPAPGLFLIAS